ncbi:MAG: transcription termination/antitermination NusG family protein, partial [Nitrospirales bacterium]
MEAMEAMEEVGEKRERKGREGSAMGKNWYVIHTYAGFEGRVKASLVERANQLGLTEKLGQVLVPT